MIIITNENNAESCASAGPSNHRTPTADAEERPMGTVSEALPPRSPHGCPETSTANRLQFQAKEDQKVRLHEKEKEINQGVVDYSSLLFFSFLLFLFSI